MAAISREGLDVNSLDEYRICSRHFVGGKPADLYDTTHPAWLPILHLGHGKCTTVARDDSVVSRYERTMERSRKKAASDELLQQVPVIVSNIVEAVITEESVLIAAEQIKIGREYVKLEGEK